MSSRVSGSPGRQSGSPLHDRGASRQDPPSCLTLVWEGPPSSSYQALRREAACRLQESRGRWDLYSEPLAEETKSSRSVCLPLQF